MHYLFDTNILLHIMRNSELWMKTEERFNFFGDNNKVFISIVSEAEIYSLANAELITTDQDFNHLDGTFLKVHCIV